MVAASNSSYDLSSFKKTPGIIIITVVIRNKKQWKYNVLKYNVLKLSTLNIQTSIVANIQHITDQARKNKCTYLSRGKLYTNCIQTNCIQTV
jgi:hypothetical protein